MGRREREERERRAHRTKLGTLLSWLAVLAWAAFIFYMSSRTASNLNTGFFAAVKDWLAAILNGIFGYREDPVSGLCHFLEYFVLGALLANALHCRLPLLQSLLLALLLSSGYGITDEVHQIFVDGRVCDFGDWATDTLGAALGCALYLPLHKLAGLRRRAL